MLQKENTDGRVARRGTRDIFPAFTLIADDLARVKAIMREQLSNCSVPVRRLVDYVSSHSGKMLRPALVLLSGLACDKVTHGHIRAAAIIEMIHNATLLHDDVVDEANSRRGYATINALNGNESAVLLGDFVLSRVLKMCARLDNGVAAEISSAALATCEGELNQVLQKGNWHLTEREYIDIITAKSAALFAGACRIGAILADAGKRRAVALTDYGRKTGIAFQITDDLLDICGQESACGKTLGKDVDTSKLTLPLIHSLRVSSKKNRAALMGLLEGREGTCTGRRRTRLCSMLSASGSINYAAKRAESYAKQAAASLDGLSQSDAKTALIDTAAFVVRRMS